MKQGKVQKSNKWYDLEDKIQRNVKLADEIVEKVKALGLRRSTQGTMGANLSDLCINLEDFVRLINQFLETDVGEKRAIGEILVELRVHLDEVKYHYSQVRRTLERVIDYCYEKSSVSS